MFEVTQVLENPQKSPRIYLGYCRRFLPDLKFYAYCPSDIAAICSAEFPECTGAARHGQGGGALAPPPGNVQMGICNPSPEFLTVFVVGLSRISGVVPTYQGRSQKFILGGYNFYCILAA